MNPRHPISRLRSPAILLGLMALIAALVARVALRQEAVVPGPAELKAFNTSAGEMLARHLGERFGGGRALIVVRPGAEDGRGTAEETALVEGFRKAAAGRLQVSGVVAPRPPESYREQLRARIEAGEVQERDAGLMLTTPDLWYDTQVLMDLIRAQPEPVTVLVSIAALPGDFPGRPELAEGLPPVALLLAPVLQVVRLLDSGRVEAMVTYKPPGAWAREDDPGADARRAFESRYLLVHAGNRADIQRRHPELFR